MTIHGDCFSPDPDDAPIHRRESAPLGGHTPLTLEELMKTAQLSASVLIVLALALTAIPTQAKTTRARRTAVRWGSYCFTTPML